MLTLLPMAAVALLVALTYLGQAYGGAVMAAALALGAWYLGGAALGSLLAVAVPAVLLALLFGVVPLRRKVVTAPLMKLVSRTLPTIGETERIALEAGTVGWDGELFGGRPDWRKLKRFAVKPLSAAERAFMAGPVEELCRMVDDWEVNQRRDLPPEVWRFIKEKKFLGMVIPAAYGGLGFSAAMHSAVVTKVASRSIAAAVTVMVPNSLGPGDLLLRYGTQAQRDHYLPRLASGEEIPCFGLTEPHAGSDAAKAESKGVVAYGTWQGKKTLGIRLTFSKRYITLAPVATVIGLAFRLHDPEHLLGEREDIGITCALLPRSLKGIRIGDRHDPMGVPFQNGPIAGTDLFIPLDFIIGGAGQAGQGWRMLMECLAAGRGISLPSLSVGGCEVATQAISAYGLLREQFGLQIARFEGVRARLARTAALAYTTNAMRRFTAGAVDAGQHPAVLSAIAKEKLTEGLRTAIDDAMDVLAGSAVMNGRHNAVARTYRSIPIAITVEGANILTRSLIIFGQGALRCHPWLQKEVDAMQARDLVAFDRAFWGHVNHTVMLLARAPLLALTGGRLVPVFGRNARYYRKLSRLAAAFALIADVGLATLGGNLKRKEHLSGRYADALSGLALASAVLKQAHDAAATGKQEAALQRPVLKWAMAQLLHETETALLEILRNLPNRPAAALARLLAFPLGARFAPPSDRLTEKLADAVLDPATGLRALLTAEVRLHKNIDTGLGRLEAAYLKLVAALPARAKLVRALRDGKLPRRPWAESAEAALAARLITKTDLGLLNEAEAAREAVIQVEAFAPEIYAKLH
jgi:acyl-CoA dehydrogenase